MFSVFFNEDIGRSTMGSEYFLGILFTGIIHAALRLKKILNVVGDDLLS